MIAILAGTYKEARCWAEAQELKPDEYFIPVSIEELMRRKDFHVVTVGFFEAMPAGFFERLLQVARNRGRMK